MKDVMLSPEEVARRASVKEEVVYTWLRGGNLPGVKLGKIWRVRARDLEAFLAARTTRTAWPEWFDDVLARLRANVPKGLTQAEVEADVLAACEEGRAEVHARRH
jgi:excisionase family DNA binding protein